MDRDTLLVALLAGRERLQSVLAGLTDAAMLDEVGDGWSRKDVLAHLEAWERRAVVLCERLRRGELPDDEVETDELNARIQRAARDRSLDDVRRGEEEAWRQLMATVGSCSDDDLFDPSRFSWTDGDPLVDWITSNANQHFDEHLEQLARAAVRRREAVPG